MKRMAIFSKTRELEGQIDEFFDKVGDGALSFKLGIGYYLSGETVGSRAFIEATRAGRGPRYPAPHDPVSSQSSGKR